MRIKRRLQEGAANRQYPTLNFHRVEQVDGGPHHLHEYDDDYDEDYAGGHDDKYDDYYDDEYEKMRMPIFSCPSSSIPTFVRD